VGEVMKTLKDVLEESISSIRTPSANTITSRTPMTIYNWEGDKFYLERIGVSDNSITPFGDLRSRLLRICVQLIKDDGSQHTIYDYDLDNYILEPPTKAMKVLYGKK